MSDPTELKRIHISAPGTNARNAQITTADGAKIHSIVSVDVRMRVHAVTRATLEIFSKFEGDAVPEFVVVDPLTGEKKLVRRIEFADGSKFEAPDNSAIELPAQDGDV